jgi:hypothetical protein
LVNGAALAGTRGQENGVLFPSANFNLQWLWKFATRAIRQAISAENSLDLPIELECSILQ